MGKSLRVIRAPRPLEYLDYDPSGFADGGYGSISDVTPSHRQGDAVTLLRERRKGFPLSVRQNRLWSASSTADV
jgi:hypothetical protein